jgi:Uricase (urate oxidase)
MNGHGNGKRQAHHVKEDDYHHEVTESAGPEEDKYELGQYGYGKNHIKLLHTHRDGAFHTIREYEVDTHLKLHSNKDFIAGDNKDIIATDTQKNTVYVLAKRNGVSAQVPSPGLPYPSV